MMENKLDEPMKQKAAAQEEMSANRHPQQQVLATPVRPPQSPRRECAT